MFDELTTTRELVDLNMLYRQNYVRENRKIKEFKHSPLSRTRFAVFATLQRASKMPKDLEDRMNSEMYKSKLPAATLST